MQRRIFSKSVAIVLEGLLFISFTSSWAQTDDQQVLASKLRFYYVAEPNNADTASYKPELLDNEAIQKETRAESFWTKTTTPRLQELVQALFCDLGDGGDVMLQRIAARIVSIKNKPVDVYLIDDVSEPLNENARVRWGRWISKSGNRVFPSGVDMSACEEMRKKCEQKMGVTESPRRDELLAGEIATGGTASSKDALAIWFLHALVHTQDGTWSRREAYGLLGTAIDTGYISSGATFVAATFPDLNMTYKEAIARTIMLWFRMSAYKARFEATYPNTILLTEKDPYPSFSEYPAHHDCADIYSPSPGGWLYDELVLRAFAKVHESEYKDYPGFVSIKMGDLPKNILAHNENILSLIFNSYLSHIDRDAFLEIMKKVYNERPNNVSPTTYIFQLLCEANLANTTSNGESQEAEKAGRTRLLPFAYLDYFTSYAAESLEDFRNLFEDSQLVMQWLETYWNRYHERVRATVKPKSENSELTDIGEIDKVVLRSEETQE